MSTQPGGLLPGLEPQGPDTKRLLITVTVVTVMWMGFQLLSPPTPPPEAKKPGEAATQTTPETTTPPTLSNPTADATANLPEEKRTFSANVEKAMADTAGVMVKGGYQAELTSHGAQLSAFKLDGYADALRKDQKTGDVPAIDLASGVDAGARLVALKSRAGDVPLAADAPYEVVPSSDPNVVAFRRTTSAGVVVNRTYTFDPARFAFVHEITLKNESSEKRSAQLDVVLTGEERAGSKV
jgi:YidC/Oxa1 family membrane protein insertase